MPHTRLSGLVAIPLLSASLLLGATSALAAGTLDQSQTDVSDDVELSDARPTGQTFTAGLTGLLDQVDLYPLKDMYGSTVQIRTVSAGLPTDTTLATGHIGSTATYSWVSIGFPSPAVVTAGTQYAIVVLPASIPKWGTSSVGAGLYAGGAAIYVLLDGVTWGTYASDLAFRTYVTRTTYGFAWRSPTRGKGEGVNKPRAGTTVPVKFRLGIGVRKSELIAPGWPKVRRVDCSTKRPKAGSESRTRPLGAEGLTRSGTDYTYSWRVPAEWGSGSYHPCREFRIKLADGTTHSALYRFQPAR